MNFINCGLVNLPGPFKFVFSIGNHLPESALFVEPFYKCLLKSIRTELLGICSKANEGEISLNEIDDHLFPDYLPVFSSSIVFVFCLDNALPQILNSCAFWRNSTDVYHLVSKNFSGFGFGTFSSSSLITSNSPIKYASLRSSLA